MTFSKLAAVGLIALAAFAGSEIAASAQSAPQGTTYVPYHRGDLRGSRPLTVNRRRAPEPVVIAAPVVAPVYGPGVIVTGPLHAASAIVGMPFQVLGGIFPAKGTVATSPLVLVGAPIQFAGEIAQMPFRVVDAVFGGPALFQ